MMAALVADAGRGDATGAALRVGVAGLLTTVQDLGRFGAARFGLSPVGALDDCALRWANLLAGNDPGAAALECTFLGPTLTLEGPRPVAAALAGADFGATLNGAPLAPWRGFTLAPGDTLALAAPKVGARCYLAVAGGIDTPPAFGSRSTDLLGGIGGLGRALRAGDLLPLAPPPAPAGEVGWLLPPARVPTYGGEIRLRVVLGPQDDRFTEDAIVTFLSSPYTVTREGDRMGVRLEGPALTFRDGPAGADIISEGVATGALQVPAHGRPIVLLAAHQTTGGYAKIGTVIGADLWRLGQARPGDTVRFRAIPLAEAREALRAYRTGFDPTALERGTTAGTTVAKGAEVARSGTEAGASEAPLPAAAGPGGWGAAEVQALLDRVVALGLAEFDLDVPGLRLRLRRGGGEAAGPGEPPPVAGTATPAPPDEVTVTAPFIGVFYRAARTGEPPLIQPGDVVEPGQPLGLIEVMKTFHEIVAPARAQVLAILVDDAAPVEWGQPLFTLSDPGDQPSGAEGPPAGGGPTER